MNDEYRTNQQPSYGGPDFGTPAHQIYEVRQDPIVPPGVPSYAGRPDFGGPIASGQMVAPTFAPVAPPSMAPQPQRRSGSVMYFLLGLFIFVLAVVTVVIGQSAAGMLLAAAPFIVIGSIIVLFTMRR